MKKILVGLLALLFLVSAASGYTKTLPQIGGSQGISARNIQTGTLTADTFATGLNISASGTLLSNFNLAAGYDIGCLAGDTKVDYSLGTGIFKTTTGTNTLSGNTAISGSKTFSTGTGAVTLNGPVGVASGIDLVAAGGASDIDYSLSSGVMKTPTGAISLNGDTTVAASTALAVTTADKLTVGGVIVPQYWDFNVPISSGSVDSNVFIPTSSWQVVAVSEVHAVAGSDSGAVNVTLRKCTGTQAPASGSAVLSSVISLKGTANTIASGSIVTGSGLAQVNSTERLALDFSGTMTALAGGVVTVRMKRV